VSALLVDGTSWPNWSPIDSFELERPGDPPPEGPGAVRVFRRGRTVGRDHIVDVVPDQRFSYVSLSGLPVRDYHAEIDLVATDHGTDIHWQASFSPKVPGTGWLLERGLRRFLCECAAGLAAHAAS
jgi:Polyketide cyclase / dehydrase and lipid transport